MAQQWLAFAFDVGGFLAKALFLVIAILVVVGFIAGLARREDPKQERLEIKRLNDRFKRFTWAIKQYVLSPAEFKKYAKTEEKSEKKEEPPKKTLFILDFDGDVEANPTAQLRHEISAILGMATEDDEVMLRLTSPGGGVSAYGHAASQLARFRPKKIKLSICVDEVAASGGYMMACVADDIIAAPFAAIGSVGVVAQVPNFHRILKKNDVDFEEVTAGKFKRTVSLLGEISEEGRQKFVEQLNEVHDQFKSFIKANRPIVDVDAIATGEYWLGERALELKLVDALGTSDDFIHARMHSHNLLELKYKEPKDWRENLSFSFIKALENTLMRLWQRGAQQFRL